VGPTELLYVCWYSQALKCFWLWNFFWFFKFITFWLCLDKPMCNKSTNKAGFLYGLLRNI
jgi:hypothetical protein